MREKLDWFKVTCDECGEAVVIYVEEGHDPYMPNELGGFQLLPSRTDRHHEYHLCPQCQKKKPKLKIIEGEKNG